MKQLIKNNKTGELTLEEVPVPALKPGCVLVKNYFSAISIGTESASIETAKMSLIQKAKSRPKEMKQVMELMKKEGVMTAYRIAMDKLKLPGYLGYSTAGEVIGVADNIYDIRIGDRIACGGASSAYHAEVVCTPRNLCVKVPEGVDLKYAAFTTIGSIALQGIRQAEVNLGDNVVVIGLGLVGQLVCQILNASGCNVIGIDLDQRKVSLVNDTGVGNALDRGTPNIEERIRYLTNGIGADAVIISAGGKSNDPVEFASAILRDRGRITDIGNVPLNLPRRDYYDKELSFNISRSYGPGRYDKKYEDKGIDYPIGYVRWTENRNMSTFLQLIQQKRIDLEPIITHEFAFEQAPSSYEHIKKTDDLVLGALFSYPRKGEIRSHYEIPQRKPVSSGLKDLIRVGFIGAGSYAQQHLLPILNDLPKIKLMGLATATGPNAKHLGEKYGFSYITTDASEIIQDDDVDILFILTRHNLHAEHVIQGLKANKNVFVEKPLCLNAYELKDIISAYEDSTGSLMIGFNRRYSPHLIELKSVFRKGPLAMNIRINAGFKGKDTWQQDPDEGGGRIIGDAVHFLDLARYICKSHPVRVFAESMNTKREDMAPNDTVAVTVSYEDGSIASINYFSNGDTLYPKERIEVFGYNSIFIIDDFKVSHFISKGKKRRFSTRKQDKGQENELSQYIESIKNGKGSLIPMEEIISATNLTFKVLESIKEGKSLPPLNS